MSISATHTVSLILFGLVFLFMAYKCGKALNETIDCIEEIEEIDNE